MERFDGSWFLHISRDFASFAATTFPDNAHVPIPEESRDTVRYLLGLLERNAAQCSLKTTVKTIEKTYASLKLETYTWSNYQDRIPIILEVLENELETVKLMRIASDKSDYYDASALFGEAVSEIFSEATYDIVEAGNCYAVGRNTASVFHLMRVIEVGLVKAANIIGVSFDFESEPPSWDQILRTIKKRVDGLESATPKEIGWRAKRQFGQTISERIRSIKDAWRNPVMHVIAQHDEHSARSIINHTEAFMRDLVKRMAELVEAEAMPLLTEGDDRSGKS